MSYQVIIIFMALNDPALHTPPQHLYENLMIFVMEDEILIMDNPSSYITLSLNHNMLSLKLHQDHQNQF